MFEPTEQERKLAGEIARKVCIRIFGKELGWMYQPDPGWAEEIASALAEERENEREWAAKIAESFSKLEQEQCGATLIGHYSDTGRQIAAEIRKREK